MIFQSLATLGLLCRGVDVGLTGRYVKTFKDGNIASTEGYHCNGPPPHTFFKIIGIEGNMVRLQDHVSHNLQIKKDNFSEFAELTMKTEFEALFGRPARKFKIRPMKGELW